MFLELLGGDKVHSSVKFVSRRGCPSPPAPLPWGEGGRSDGGRGGRGRGQLPTEPHFLAGWGFSLRLRRSRAVSATRSLLTEDFLHNKKNATFFNPSVFKK